MNKPLEPTLVDKVTGFIRQWDGKLTRELLLTPGGFGLGQVPDKRKPDATTTMVCGFCSTGCGLNIHLKDGEAISLTPATKYPVNLGMACPKGWEALTVLKSNDRGTTPLFRDIDGAMKPIDWPTAAQTFTDRFKAIQRRYGKDSVAWIGTGQIPTEELAFLGAFGKFGMGMVHGDGNTRQCMATAAVAYKQSFGFDSPPFTYSDFEQSDVIMLVGSNLCIAHPIMWERVMRNPHKPEIIVVDPRKTETAMAATQHLAIAPKSDLALFYGLANILIREGWINPEFIAAHTTGFDDFKAHVASFTPESVAEKSGIPVETLLHVAKLIGTGKRVSLWWTMGVNQSYEGTRLAQSLINLALMTGNIGRPGTGANSITGQCNAMGSRIFSNTTNLLGGRDFTNPEHRREVAGLLGFAEEAIPDKNSLAYNEIFEAIEAGKIKGLWILATNTAHSWINQKRLEEVFSKLEFLVVQDMYHSTETAVRADLYLPAAAWGEKEGTFINSERRIGLLKKVVRAPGQALSDFNIVRLLAHYWGCGEMFREWTSPEAVFQILKRLSKGRPCDITGIEDYRMLDRLGGVQWPWPEQPGFGFRGPGSGTETADATQEPSTDSASAETHDSKSVSEPGPRNPDPGRSDPEQERRLFADGQFFHADGKAKFIFEAPREMPEPPDEEYPITLLTGRGSASQWHTQTRTKKSPVLRKLYPQNIYVELSAADAQRLKIADHEWVSIESRRGKIKAMAFITHSVQQGHVFIPMHYEITNQLTQSVFDPYSKQPSYKQCAVRVAKV